MQPKGVPTPSKGSHPSPDPWNRPSFEFAHGAWPGQWLEGSQRNPLGIWRGERKKGARCEVGAGRGVTARLMARVEAGWLAGNERESRLGDLLGDVLRLGGGQ